MNHTEAIQEIIKVIPESQEDFKENYKTNNSFMVINVFTKRIKKIIQSENETILIRCLDKMNDIYKTGDLALKNAVESVFIYSLDSLTFSCNKHYKNLILDKIPFELQRVYLHQVYKSGI